MTWLLKQIETVLHPKPLASEVQAPKCSPRYTYFPLWAKGPAVALALQHSGLEWEGSKLRLSLRLGFVGCGVCVSSLGFRDQLV